MRVVQPISGGSKLCSKGLVLLNAYSVRGFELLRGASQSDISSFCIRTILVRFDTIRMSAVTFLV